MEASERNHLCRKDTVLRYHGWTGGDTGVITTANGVFRVEDTIKLRGGKYGHVGVMESV